MNKYLIILYHTHNARHILANIILDSKIETSSRATVHSYLLNTVGLGIGTSSPINDRAHAWQTREQPSERIDRVKCHYIQLQNDMSMSSTFLDVSLCRALRYLPPWRDLTAL